jgi:hypothetical protein
MSGAASPNLLSCLCYRQLLTSINHSLPTSLFRCPYLIHVYPTEVYEDSFYTNNPSTIATSLAAVFAFSIAVFFLYDWIVERRQSRVLAQATQSTAIVSSLFPRKVRDRLMEEQKEKLNVKKGGQILAQNRRLKTFLNTKDGADNGDSDPIADLFPDCTVFFGDIAGFTGKWLLFASWSHRVLLSSSCPVSCTVSIQSLE